MYCIVIANTCLHVCCIKSFSFESPSSLERETASLQVFAMTSVIHKQGAFKHY